MRISDWINVVLSALSLILAMISVITVVITLRQNHRMVENATRPYVTLYGAVTGFDTAVFYLVLRNYGQSSALITEFSSSTDTSRLTFDARLPTPFEHIVGHTLAPGQAVQVPINHRQLKPEETSLSFIIKYSCAGKTYKEAATVNIQAHYDNLIVHADQQKNNAVETISRTLQEIAVRQL